MAVSLSLVDGFSMELPFERAAGELPRQLEEAIVMHLYSLPHNQIVLSGELALVSALERIESVDQILLKENDRQTKVGFVVRRLIEDEVVNERLVGGRSVFKLSAKVAKALRVPVGA